VAIFDALRKVKYDGYVTLEAILGGNLLADLVAARKYLEKVMG
jgi:sugar phosphate isomerase/epimerase